MRIDRLREEISKLVVKSEKLVILDGHYAQNVAPTDLIFRVLVLRRAPWILKRHLEERNYNPRKVWENLEAEIMGVCLTESIETFTSKLVCEIDTTDKNIDEILKEALSILEGKSPCQVDRLDWITREETLELLRDRKCLS